MVGSIARDLLVFRMTVPVNPNILALCSFQDSLKKTRFVLIHAIQLTTTR